MDGLLEICNQNSKHFPFGLKKREEQRWEERILDEMIRTHECMIFLFFGKKYLGSFRTEWYINVIISYVSMEIKWDYWYFRFCSLFSKSKSYVSIEIFFPGMFKNTNVIDDGTSVCTVIARKIEKTSRTFSTSLVLEIFYTSIDIVPVHSFHTIKPMFSQWIWSQLFWCLWGGKHLHFLYNVSTILPFF